MLCHLLFVAGSEWVVYIFMHHVLLRCLICPSILTINFLLWFHHKFNSIFSKINKIYEFQRKTNVLVTARLCLGIKFYTLILF